MLAHLEELPTAAFLPYFNVHRAWLWRQRNGGWIREKTFVFQLRSKRYFFVAIDESEVPMVCAGQLRHGGAWLTIDGSLCWLGLSSAKPSHLQRQDGGER